MAKALLLILFSLSTLAAPECSREVKHLLPQDLQHFEIKKTPLQEVQKKLGKPQLVEGNKYYWETNGFKYSLELIFDKKQILQSLHYTFTGTYPALEKLGAFDTKDLRPVVQKGGVSSTLMKLKSSNCEVTLNISNKTIDSVRFP